MSKGFDYSKFDKITDADSDDERPVVPSSGPVDKPVKMTPKGKENRLQFKHDGRVVYEWEQNLEEVNIYIVPPKGIPRNMIDVVIEHKHLKVGLKGNPPFIDEDTGGPIKIKESTWILDEGEININLQKMLKAEQWNCALVGKGGEQVDPFTQEEIKKKLMLERFQEENPTFDFSNAEFNGAVPSARSFMGGISHK